ncbi:MAG TPA: biotin--[acetyl-CoA-carboxylase] ligase, partial [Geobacterales bacterium]|nr:biotin--[acetyl-CoA-carboxylase] ligase [Geobacterales bacterium]
MKGESRTAAPPAHLDREILLLLGESGNEPVSGGDLARRFAISRTAVWKHIRALIDQGYRIESVAARGYRLTGSSDMLDAGEIQNGLAVKRIGRHVLVLRETDSTNILAMKMANDGEPEGTVIIADRQLQGKGRLGRSWESPPGVNLYCSVIIRPPLPPHEAAQLTFISAVAVARAIERCTALKADIKWPNDLLINGHKVAGLLNEMSAETERLRHVVLGIGVNLNMEASQLPPRIRYPASSLFLEGGKPVSRSTFARQLIVELDALYEDFLRDGFAPVRQAWLERSFLMGRTVRVSEP